MSRQTSAQTLSVTNLGTYDRVLRYLLAVTLLAPAFVISETGTLDWLALPVLASIYPTLTAVTGWDPIYHWMGLSTVRENYAPIDPVQTVETVVRRYHGPRQAANQDNEDQRRAA